MKKQAIIKFFSMILGLYLTVSVTAAIQINAEEKQNTETQKTETEGLPAETNAEVIDSGTCGENLTWELTDDGTLMISGKGEMECFGFFDETPWNPSRLKIKNIRISNEITSIGDNAFGDLEKVIRVDLPKSITKIGKAAFVGCSSLNVIGLPEGITSIESNAFASCSSITNIVIPKGVKSIEFQAFAGCISLSNITLSEGLEYIGRSAFLNCHSLSDVYYCGAKTESIIV